MISDFHQHDLLDRVGLFQHFFKHENLKQVDDFINIGEMKRRIIAVDFVYRKDNQLRMCFYMKSREIDQLFRRAEDVFDGWDGFYSFIMPAADNMAENERIANGVRKILIGLLDLMNGSDKFWFVIKDEDKFYCIGKNSA